MYYLAIVCPQAIDQKVSQFKQLMKDRFSCIVAMKSPAHITLIAPFWFDEDREHELVDALASFHSDMETLTLHLAGFNHFNRRVLFVELEAQPALEELREQLSQYFTTRFPGEIKKDLRPFHPHVTIATRDLKPGDFIKAWDYFSHQEFTASFTTQTISLLKLSPGKWNVFSEQQW
jgi:2'-5' RNA ligase